MRNLKDVLLRKNIAVELWNDWHWQIEHSISSTEQFLSISGIDGDMVQYYKSVISRYSIRITPYYLSLIKNTIDKDPVAYQCFPRIEELEENGDSEQDPFDELGNMPVPGVIHRYRDRLVLLVSDICAMNCRHCTRKNILGDNVALYSDYKLQVAFDYIKSVKGVREVLVSGGDPFMLETERLDFILDNLSKIDHVEVIRIGTRVPVVLPMRVDDELCQMLAQYRPLWINTQFNHPAELSSDAVQACDRLLLTGLPVSNQTVLLKGVNDDVEVMSELCTKLQRNMIRPYYVFQCDPVVGTFHFRTELSVGIDMEEKLRQTIGGLALPRFVADLPDSEGKVPLLRI